MWKESHTHTSGFQKKQKQLSCIDRMLNLVETSLKILVKETNFGKYKRLYEVHFTPQRRRVWEQELHLGIALHRHGCKWSNTFLQSNVLELTHSFTDGGGGYKVIKSSFIKFFSARNYLEKGKTHLICV